MRLTGVTRYVFSIFFASHIPITLFIDGQVIFPKNWVPKPCQDALEFYSRTFSDHLMTPPYDNIFFSSFVLCELLFQLPFFVVATYALVTSDKISGKGWFRSACMIYGAHTTTTLVPILASIVTEKATTGIQKMTLFLFYFPYLLFPLWLTIIAATTEDMFHDKSRKEDAVHAKIM
mmetsp:Transcript_18130/g.25807  ORF Transcript_18130/g.25807 Transcript_18130/m.25807 type:complete len:176 (+) Transcript_18130:92-619(+)